MNSKTGLSAAETQKYKIRTFRLLAFSGIQSEALALTWNDINLIRHKLQSTKL